MTNPFSPGKRNNRTPPNFVGQDLTHLKQNSSFSPEYLTDEQLQCFLLNGYLILDPKLPREIHEYIRNQTEDYYKSSNDEEFNPDFTNPGNNLLALFPALQRVIKNEIVDGALRSVLGEHYELHPHKFCHRTFPGKEAQAWHKDSYWGYQKMVRSNRIRYAMIMYYPQTVKMDNGPTWIKPGSQYGSIDPKRYKGNLDNKWKRNQKGKDLPIEIPEGSVVLIHYNVIHKGGKNLKNYLRQMYKIQFVRMDEPDQYEPITRGPWENLSYPRTFAELVGEDIDVSALRLQGLLITDNGQLNHKRLKQMQYSMNEVRHIMSKLTEFQSGILTQQESLLIEPVASSIWDWMRGEKEILEPLPDDEKNWLLHLCQSSDELQRYYAAYKLARCNHTSELLSMFLDHSTDDQIKIDLTLALSSIITNANDLLSPLIDALSNKSYSNMYPMIISLLSELGHYPEAVEAVIAHKSNPARQVRLYVAEYLGIIGNQMNPTDNIDQILDTLSDLMSDAEAQIRFTACLSAAKIGPPSEPLLDHLIDALTDQNRYVQGYAVMALKRINTAPAQRILLEYLYTARYDPLTTHRSQW